MRTTNIFSKCFSGFQCSIFFKGMLMGICDLIPGISGGTIAFTTGIYNELLLNLKKINFSFFKDLFFLNFKKITQRLNIKFLFSLFSGIALSLLLFSRFIEFCLNHQHLNSYLYSIFFGFIIGATFFLIKQLKEINILDIIFLIIGFLFSFFFTEFFVIQHFQSDNVFFAYCDPFLIISGSIAFCAMLIPGISGSMILLLLGQYHKVIKALASLAKMEIEAIFVFLNLGIGIILAMSIFSKILFFLLNRYWSMTICLFLGLMLGSIKIICPFLKANNPEICLIDTNVFSVIFSFTFCRYLILMTVGIAIFFITQLIGQKKKSKT